MTTYPSIEDRQLLELIAAGDENAFSRLLGKYYSFCTEIAKKILRDKYNAEDIVQEVFLKIWLRRSTLPDIDNFTAWLRTITVNHIYNFIRDLKVEHKHYDRWQKEFTLPALQEEQPTREQSDYQELVSQALFLLTPRQKEVFTLIKLEGYSREEAAKALGIGKESVKTHLDQAMKTVRAYCLGRLDKSSFIVMFSILFQKYF